MELKTTEGVFNYISSRARIFLRRVCGGQINFLMLMVVLTELLTKLFRLMVSLLMLRDLKRALLVFWRNLATNLRREYLPWSASINVNKAQYESLLLTISQIHVVYLFKKQTKREANKSKYNKVLTQRCVFM